MCAVCHADEEINIGLYQASGLTPVSRSLIRYNWNLILGRIIESLEKGALWLGNITSIHLRAMFNSSGCVICLNIMTVISIYFTFWWGPFCHELATNAKELNNNYSIRDTRQSTRWQCLALKYSALSVWQWTHAVMVQWVRNTSTLQTGCVS